MGLLNSLTVATYRRDSAGRAIFCPWGNWGRCYAVPPEREEELLRFLRRTYLILFVLLVPAVLWLGWWAVLLAPVCSAVIFAKYWAFGRTLVPLDGARPSVERGALFRAHARAAGRGYLWFSLIGSLLFVATGVWMYWRGVHTIETYVVIGFFALAAILNIVQIRQVR
jgi:hypothetical protein